MNMHMPLLVLCLALGLPGVAAAQDARPVEVPVAELAEAAKVQQALEEFIRAYETGNVGLLRSRLDPTMIGYQRFIDGVIQDGSRLRQIRLHLLDSQSLVGPDVAMVQTRWEKRFLSATDLRPGLYTGTSQFLLHRGKDGWRVAAVGGDNPFASQSGVLGRLLLTNVGTPSVPAVSVEVIDPDIAGLGAIVVQLALRDTVIPLTLTETTPGRYVQPFAHAASGPVTLRYMDANPGGGRPPSLLTHSIVLP